MIMLFKIFSRSVIIFFIFIISCFSEIYSAKVIVIDRIYIIVNSQMITRSEALDFLSNLSSQSSNTKISKEELHKKFLMNLIQDLLLLDRANALKITPSNNEIETRFKKISEQQPNLLEVFSEEDLREQISKEFKKQRVINHEVGSKIHIDSSEIASFCKKQIRKNRKVGLSQILLKGSEEKIRQKTKIILHDFKNGVKFDELARIHSTDPNAKITGGRLGVFKSSDLLTKIGEVIENLDPGEISKIVKTDLGNHLLYIFKEVLPENAKCDNLKDDLESEYSNSLYNQKRNSLLNKYMDELYNCANIIIKDPEDIDLPKSDFLPEVKNNQVNCQDRRIMILPKKKEKAPQKRKK